MNERRRFWGRKVFWFDITKRMSKKIYWFKLPLCKRPILQFTVCFFVGLFELQSELLQLHSFRSWYDSVLEISFLFYWSLYRTPLARKVVFARWTTLAVSSFLQLNSLHFDWSALFWRIDLFAIILQCSLNNKFKGEASMPIYIGYF